jgi:FAD/FMN-containing dehydrogenase
MAAGWRNWSGSIAFAPRRRVEPRDEDELAAAVHEARRQGLRVRAVGAGHSSSDVVRADDMLLSTARLTGVVRTDRDACTATVRAGTPLADLGKALHEDDLALPNYGDVATQTIGGAIGTGTHGSGREQRNLSAMLVGARLVDGHGDVRTLHRDDTDTLRAARVALGTLGIFTEVTLQLVPAFDVVRREYAIGTDGALEQLETLVAGNRSFDFYWYPRRDDIKLRTVNPIGGGVAPHGARALVHVDGYGHEIIPTHSGIPHRFEESEFALPAEAGPACFAAVRARVLARWRHVVGWRVLYRTVAADDAFLSPAHGRATVTISLHQNASLPWREYFDDLAPVFLAHGGRPHWAKKHRLVAADLAPRYPHWDDFQAVRTAFDPDGTFATPYLRALLGIAA